MSNLPSESRPHCFGDVVGQEITVSQILNYIKHIKANQKDSHVPILLTGPSGVGKTTIARLIAMWLNCIAEEQDPNIICSCENCQALIKNPDNVNGYLEFASANVGSLDNIFSRMYSSPRGHMNIFFCDEFHSYSHQALEKLLKPMEKLPPKVLFVFATAEGWKVKNTLSSRFKERHLRLLTKQEIKKQLIKIGKEKGERDSRFTEIDVPILDFICQKSKGSLRVALETLDSILELPEITIELVEAHYTEPKLFNLVLSIFQKELAKGFFILQEIEGSGSEPKQLIESLQTIVNDIQKFLIDEHLDTVFPKEWYSENKSKLLAIDILIVQKEILSMIELTMINYAVLQFLLAKINKELQETQEEVVYTSINDAYTNHNPSYLQQSSDKPYEFKKGASTLDMIGSVLNAGHSHESPAPPSEPQLVITPTIDDVDDNFFGVL